MDRSSVIMLRFKKTLFNKGSFDTVKIKDKCTWEELLNWLLLILTEHSVRVLCTSTCYSCKIDVVVTPEAVLVVPVFTNSLSGSSLHPQGRIESHETDNERKKRKRGPKTRELHELLNMYVKPKRLKNIKQSVSVQLHVTAVKLTYCTVCNSHSWGESESQILLFLCTAVHVILCLFTSLSLLYYCISFFWLHPQGRIESHETDNERKKDERRPKTR